MVDRHTFVEGIDWIDDDPDLRASHSNKLQNNSWRSSNHHLTYGVLQRKLTAQYGVPTQQSLDIFVLYALWLSHMHARHQDRYR